MACSVPAQPIRRLSRSEYERTVRDLFQGARLPATFTFAPDQTLGGFSNNYSALNPSALLVEQYWNAALSIVKSAAPDLAALLPCDSAGGIACAEAFIRDFGRRAYRRPLTDQEVTELRAGFESGPGSTDFTVGVQLAMLAMLQSPSFLYRPEFGVEGSANPALSGFETASRLSYFLWGTMPDGELLDKAQGLELATSEQIAAQAQRMLQSPKAKEGMLHFHREWLKVSQLDLVSKKEGDRYDVATRDAIKESLDRFVWDTLFVRGGSALQLLTADVFPANQRVAELLGASPVAAGAWADVNVAGARRAGILTHPAFLASHAYANYPSPVLRGVFVLDRILCAPPSPPPDDVNATPPDAPSGSTPVTNRERYAETTKEPRCMGCHTSINGIGFAFENFDTMGRFIESDNGKPVDASGAALGLSYQSASELGAALAGTDQYRSCVVDKWLNYALGGSPLAQDQCLRAELTKTFAERNFNVKELVLAIATNPKFSQSFVKGAQ